MAWAETLDALVRERGGALYGYAFVLTGDPRAADELPVEFRDEGVRPWGPIQ